MKYPPPLTDDQLDELIFNVKDWQLTHGSLLKIVDSDEESSVLAHSIGVSLFPTLFPRTLFDEALALQRIYNKLYAAVAEDEKWLHDTLKGLIELDILADTLWDIYLEVKREGYSQDLTLGIFRSDYMLHADADFPKTNERVQIKQVEFNTVSCAGGVHG
jgi:glutathione synthase